MKKAVLIVSVGTGQIDVLEYTIGKFKEQIQKSFPEWKCYLGFSNERILNKMRLQKPDTFFSVEEAMEQMLAEGIETVLVQQTYLLNGMENDSLLEQIEPYKTKFSRLLMSQPLLCAKADYQNVLHAILSEISPEEGEALVLVGHGSNPSVNTAYQNLEYTAYVQGIRNVYVGTMSDEKSRRMTMRKLSSQGFQKVRLMPLLFVAGYHAKKDIVAKEDSWKSVLEAEGFTVTEAMIGLGEMESVAKLFVGHMQMTIANSDEV